MVTTATYLECGSQAISNWYTDLIIEHIILLFWPDRSNWDILGKLGKNWSLRVLDPYQYFAESKAKISIQDQYPRSVDFE